MEKRGDLGGCPVPVLPGDAPQFAICIRPQHHSGRRTQRFGHNAAGILQHLGRVDLPDLPPDLLFVDAVCCEQVSLLAESYGT